MQQLIKDNKLFCLGVWCVDQLLTPSPAFSMPTHAKDLQFIIDGTGITALDSAGASRIARYRAELTALGFEVDLQGFKPEQQQLVILVASHLPNKALGDLVPPTPRPLVRLGQHSYQLARHLYALLEFLGEFFSAFFHALLRPRLLLTADFIYEIGETGVKALLIVGLLSFLIGIVLAHQMGLQLSMYGADIFIVELSSIAILREFAPLMAAIILAGRTSAAFTAELGMMRFNSEIDLLTTMGISPMLELIMPRILSLLVVVPLIVFWADLWGVLGSLVMANFMLAINPVTYLIRFRTEVPVDNYLIGLFKAPFFAFIIGAVGCFEGLQCQPTADSIGKQTTRSVVETIFLIIIADAGFSVLFSSLGI